MKDKRSFVRAMFARIAPTYDLANRLMTFGMDQRWRRRAVRIALDNDLDRPTYLDIGTGTGDLAIMLTTLSQHAQVVGIDLTREMMDIARGKMHLQTFIAPPSLVNGDTLDLPFPPATFDGITSAFVLRNLTDLDRAFGEMVRVARPNAHVVALEITRPRQPLWSALFRLYFFRIVPLLGGIVSGNLAAYRYLPHSLSIFVSADELSEIMTRAGLRNVQYHLLNLGTVAIHSGVK